MSQVSFKGNVGKVRGLQFAAGDGKPRFSFSVAEGHSKSDGNGGWVDIGTTWWNVTVFGKDAETLADVIQEGQKQRVAISGRASTREYEVDGQKRESLDVVADVVGIIPRSQQAQQQAPATSGANTWQQPSTAPASGSWGNGPASTEAPF